MECLSANFALSDLDLNFQGQVFTENCKTLLSSSDRKSGICHRNGPPPANVVHHDFDLHFQGHENVNTSKTLMLKYDFYRRTDICHREWCTP